jgi:hypothetical protein
LSLHGQAGRLTPAGAFVAGFAGADVFEVDCLMEVMKVE